MKPVQTYFCAILSLFILAAPAIAQDCTAQLSLYNCVSITSCMDTSGVCECANGNQCVWTNQGYQTVNCPCYSGTAYNAASSNCAALFVANNCGYETTCNTNINTVTCRCPDGTTCIYNDSITLNCPCVGAYPDMATYKTNKVNECAQMKTAHNCPSDPIHCMSGIGTCKCNDGSLCAWGPNYVVNCPCT